MEGAEAMEGAGDDPLAGASFDERLDAAAAEAKLDDAAALPPLPVLDERSRRASLIAFAVSGATAMTLQVLWTRALAVLLGSSVFSFTLILLALLIGLGVGAAVFGRASQRTAHPVRWLAALHLATAIAIGTTYLFTDKIPFVFTWLLQSTSFGVDAILVCQFVLACITVLPATILMGGVFPLTVRIAAGKLDSVGRDVGRAYALNTLGAIVGSFLSGFIVLPKLGLQRGIYAAALGDLVLAAVLFWVAPAWSARRRWAGVAAAVALALLGLVLPRWDLVSFSSGFFRMSIAHEYISRKVQKREWKNPKLVFYEDGIATTVSVDQWGKTYSLKNNGKVDASNDADMPTQIIVGLLPLLLLRQADAAQGGADRLRLGRHRRRDHPVPDRVAGGGGAGAGGLSGLALLRQRQPPAPGKSQGDGARGRRTELPHPAQRQVRRHRQRAVEPLADRRVEPVHARVLPQREDPPRAARDLLPVGAALRDGPLEHQDHLPDGARRVPATSTSSPPRICRRTRS